MSNAFDAFIPGPSPANISNSEAALGMPLTSGPPFSQLPKLGLEPTRPQRREAGEKRTEKLGQIYLSPP